MSPPAPAIKHVAVLGGTGGLGHYLVTGLLARVPSQLDAVSVVSRTPASELKPEAKKLIDAGAKLIHVADYASDAFAEAMKGVDCVVSAVAGDAIPSQIDWAPALVKAGVKLFFQSEWGVGENEGEDINQDYYNNAGRKVREAYKEAGIPVVQFCNGWFVEYLDYPPFLTIDIEKRTAAINGDGNAAITWTHQKDIAEGVANLVADTGKWWSRLKDGTWECCIAGDEKNHNQIVDIIERYAGVKLERKYTPVAELQAKYDAARAKAKSAYETIELELSITLATGKDRIPKEKLVNELVYGETKLATVEDYVREKYGKAGKL
ncbi:hypothetical protein DFJ74DRAFT_662937 [Hyaloraphidium curvatum]|nr:hypothetical protein DFJ74DRAFT_662937 [Hyaloraphidium curvatum]